MPDLSPVLAEAVAAANRKLAQQLEEIERLRTRGVALITISGVLTGLIGQDLKGWSALAIFCFLAVTAGAALYVVSPTSPVVGNADASGLVALDERGGDPEVGLRQHVRDLAKAADCNQLAVHRRRVAVAVAAGGVTAQVVGLLIARAW